MSFASVSVAFLVKFSVESSVECVVRGKCFPFIIVLDVVYLSGSVYCSCATWIIKIKVRNLCVCVLAYLCIVKSVSLIYFHI